MWSFSVLFCVLIYFAECAPQRELIPLEAPDNLTLVEFDDKDVIVTWDPVDPQSVRGTFRGYLVRVWNHAFSQVYAIPPDVTKTAIQFFPYSKNFVTAAVRNDKYVGPRSNAISFDAPQTEPNMPLLFEHYQLGVHSVLLQWSKPSQPNGVLLGYNVYCSEMEGSTINERTTVKYFIAGQDNLQAKLTGLKEGNKYFIEIGSLNCIGESEHKAIEVELQAHTPHKPSIPSFKYKIDYNLTNRDFVIKERCEKLNERQNSRGTHPIYETSDDFYIASETTTQHDNTNTLFVQTNCLVNTLIKWIPDIDNNPGENFYIKYRIKGEPEFMNTTMETEEDYTIMENFNACVNYEIILVAVDGDFETESEIQETPVVVFMKYAHRWY